MLEKDTKWNIAYCFDGTRICVKRNSINEVIAFLLKHSARSDFDPANYAIYPPDSNLTIPELFSYGFPQYMEQLLTRKHLH